MSADKDKDEQHENLFKIMDGVISQINRTKKLFIIMIITTMIVSPIALLISAVLFTPPFEDTNETPSQHDGRIHHFFPLRLLPAIVSAVWLGIGVRQWFVLSKWTSKYDKYKKMQKEIDKKLSDEDENESTK
ncbi:MAG: hypothetical protein ABI340_08640 [Nitrososphaera sp.]|jgi:hypothetical protein